MKPQLLEPAQYYKLAYDSKERFCNYWHQINEVISLDPEKVLEIGIGNSFVSNYLKQRKIRVTTLDIDKRLNPDITGSVLELPFANKSFDLVSCCQTLEHLPFKDFNKALSEIFRVSKKHAIVSLPDINRVYRFSIQIPKVGEIKKLIPFPRFKKQIHSFDKEHYWEIGKAEYPLSKIISNIEKIGFNIERTYRPFEAYNSRFFILVKRV